MTIPEEVDIIVAGGESQSSSAHRNCSRGNSNQTEFITGGSCGCVIAGRLANLDPKLKVLLIESGENNINNPWVYRPAIFPRNMKLDSKTATFYKAKRTHDPFLAGAETMLTQCSE
jgi:hypothetical protein